MSDRIRELVAIVAYSLDENDYLVRCGWADDAHGALDEIAAIARGAEATCKRLVAERDALLEERDALQAEHEAWKAWSEAEEAASKIPSDDEWLDLTRLESEHQAAYDHAEKVLRGE